jgi:multisubunit Na+/H+ antiporter MnhC subunit
MYVGVTILFVLIVVLGVVHYLQLHPNIIYFLIGAAIVAGGIWLFIVSTGGPAKEEEH